MKITAVIPKEAAQKENILLPLATNYPVEKQEFFSYLSEANQKMLTAFAAGNFHAEEGEIKSLWLGSKKPSRIVLFGLGDIKKWNERKTPLIARRLVQYAKKENFKDFSVHSIFWGRRDRKELCGVAFRFQAKASGFLRLRPGSSGPQTQRSSFYFAAKDTKKTPVFRQGG